MNYPIARSFSKILTLLVILVLVLDALGTGVKPALALTTTIDDIPVAAVLIPDAPPAPNCTNRTNHRRLAEPIIIGDVNIGLNISHPRRSDARATLTSPAGTTVVLISGAGLGNPVVASPDDYDNYDVLLDDSSINSLYDNDNDAMWLRLSTIAMRARLKRSSTSKAKTRLETGLSHFAIPGTAMLEPTTARNSPS